MKALPITSLLADLIDDAREPAVAWQIAAILLCVAVGWGAARWLRQRLLKPAVQPNMVQPGMVQFGIDSLARVLAPLLTLPLLAGARFALAHTHHVNVLRVAIPVCASLALIRLGFFLLRRVFARKGQIGATILTFEKIFALLVWLGVTLYIAGLWPQLLDFLNTNTVPLGRHDVTLAAILQAGASVAVFLMLALWAGAALEERLMHVEGLHSSLRVAMARMSRAVLIIVAVLVSLSLVGIDLTVLSVFGGALGVGLGLGLQKIASNYVSGFVILLERSLAIGDMIAVDKYYGKVTQINTRYTVVQGLDGIETVLPNEMLVSGAVQNYSLSAPTVRLATHVTVTYDSDLASLLPLMEQMVLGVPRVLADPAPGAMLSKFTTDGFELELGFWIADPENGKGGVISDVNKKIWEILQSEQFKLPFPVRDTRFLDARIASVLAGMSNGGMVGGTGGAGNP
ncbi:MAG: mechanosensitive ion channel domain-containing protein [Pseudomonadota bacterium]